MQSKYPATLTFKYNYIVDINERGQYSAHVEDCNDDVIYTITQNEDGEVELIRDGFMRHVEDMRGLTRYLVDMGIIPADSVLKYNG